MDQTLHDLEFFTRSGILGVSKQGFAIKKCIGALLNSDVEFNENAMSTIKSFKSKLALLGRYCKEYNLISKDLVERNCSPQEIIQGLGDNLDSLIKDANILEVNLKNFISQNNLEYNSETNQIVLIHPENSSHRLDSKNPVSSSAVSENLKSTSSDSSSSEPCIEKPDSETFISTTEVSDQCICSEPSVTEPIVISHFSDKNLLGNHIFFEVGIPFTIPKKSIPLQYFPSNYTSLLHRPELKLTLTKSPNGNYKVFLGISYNLNFEFSNIKKRPFEKQNRLNLQVKNSIVKIYSPLNGTESKICISVGQIFKVSNQKYNVSANFVFQKNRLEPQNFSFKSEFMSSPIVKTIKTNKCFIGTPSLSFEFFPFFHTNNLVTKTTPKKTDNLFSQNTNLASDICIQKNSIISAIPFDNTTSVITENQYEQGIGIDPTPPCVQHKYYNSYRVGFFSVALLISSAWVSSILNWFWQKNSKNL